MGMESGTVAETGSGSGIEGATEKRARLGTGSIVLAEGSDGSLGEGSRHEIAPPAPPEDATMGAVAGPSQVHVPAKLNLSKISPDVRGHTSYLTFARLVPFLLPPEPSVQIQDPPHVA